MGKIQLMYHFEWLMGELWVKKTLLAWMLIPSCNGGRVTHRALCGPWRCWPWEHWRGVPATWRISDIHSCKFTSDQTCSELLLVHDCRGLFRVNCIRLIYSIWCCVNWVQFGFIILHEPYWWFWRHILNVHIHVNIYLYIHMCVCMLICNEDYIYMCVCVCAHAAI